MATTILRSIDPETDLRLARLHLRMGQLGLARAELEALAGSGHLDDEGLLALAEARWRTGDVPGAGEAAQAYLESGGANVVGLVIAAEAVAADGRPGEARRIAARVLDRTDIPLDPLFGGMPRSSIWPPDPAGRGEAGGTLFGADDSVPRPPSDGRDAEPATPDPEPSGPGFWDAMEPEPAALPEPAELFEVARAELRAGRLAEAALRFAIVLRADPDLAAVVVEATESLTRSAEIELVRGDAFGVLGQDHEARRSYAAAAALVLKHQVNADGADAPADPTSQENT